MSNSMNEIDIGVEDVTFEEVGGSKQENEKFGGGFELLMNTSLQNKDSKSDAESDIDLAEIKELSDKLNDDEDEMPSRKRSSLF